MSRRRRPPLLRVALGVAGAIGIVGLTPVPSTGAPGQTVGPPPYTGTASASGVSVTIKVPGFPATETPVDAGGPTAQVGADSLGSSQGYAAFPNPGELVISLPGLLGGLVGGGAGGLPPIPLPSLPTYPLFVASDAATNPEATVGAGPYSLRAESEVNRSSASATGGFKAAIAGNAGLLESTAEMEASEDGVEFTATTNMEALTVGPLTIGQIKSTATQTLGSDGTPTPSSSIEISGLRIAGIPIAFNPDGLQVASQVIPLPLNDLFTSLLAASSITVEVLTEQRFEGRVVAPSLRISMPVTVEGVGTGVGTATVIIGAATAALTGVAPSGGAPPTEPDLGSTGDTTVDLGGSGALPDLGSSPSSLLPTPTATPLPSTTPVGTVGERQLVGLFDLRSLYLLMVVGALSTWLLGQFVRLVGVRNPWTSTAG